MPEKLDFKMAASTASMIYMSCARILLGKRKHEPFKGMWALPGGFHNCDQETLEETAIREMFEETNLKINELELFCVNSDPKRDPRGHVIDHVFIVKNVTGKISSNDDLEGVKFFNYYELPEMAFDHGEVIKRYLKERFRKNIHNKILRKHGFNLE